MTVTGPPPAGRYAPVTAGQQRLWFLAQMDPGSLDYHIPLAFRLRGPLDETALAAALDDVVQRHAALRTRFPLVDGAPVQEVIDGWHLPVELIDLSAAGAADAERQASELVARRANTPFDLAAAAPLRAAVLRLGAGDHVLCLVIHHILADDWSLDLLGDEIAEGYAARLDGRPARRPDLPIQYADHARAEQARLAAGATDTNREEAMAYWSRELAGAPILELPTDRPRPALRGTAGAFDGFHLGPSAVDDVRQLGRLGRTTPFMTLLAGYLALLGLYTGQRDICVGSPVSGRDRTELEPLIGFFLNTVVLRGDLSGNPTFRELLRRVKATAIDAYSHREVPVEQLMTRLNVRRDPSRSPLFDTMLIVHSGGSHPGVGERRLSLPGVTAEYFDPGHREVKFDLTVECFVASDELKVVANYRTDLFHPASVARMVRHFGALLRLAAQAPDEPLSRLYARLSAQEQGPDKAGCPTAASSPAPAVLDLFAAQVAATPDAMAVWHGDTRLRYAELDRRARRLAGLLRERGAAPGLLVGVCLPPGADLVTTVLAVLMTGAAYLPLDPDHPPRRLAYLLADSAAPILVTTGAHRDRLPAASVTASLTASLRVVELDSLMWTDEVGIGGPPGGSPGRIACAIYTSGSTGEPKAVRVPYAALAARVRWMRARYAITADDRVLQFSSPSFDTFGEELYPCLTSGATLVVPVGSRAELTDFLATEGGRALTVLDLPTAYFHELAADPLAVAWPPNLRLLILGGEQVRADALARWFAAFGDRVEVVNTYGPTEATIIATATRLTAADALGRPPIGHPIADTCVHVLDEDGVAVPAGVVGELVIGGAGVADGYLGRPELTASRFAPFNGAPHYRTGDRVRRRGDGALEFFGRLDGQFKVRGYRVEAGEVEAALTAHPAVRHAVVGVDEDGRLVAHLVAQPGAAVPGGAELRAHLADRLPAYLHPQAYATLDSLPMTRHGKVDRAALPAVAPDRAGDSPMVEPRTDGERLIAKVWAEVLGVEHIGVQDDFFDLGGHSLLATRVAARLRSATGVEVPLRTIFRSTTVVELADAVEELLIAEIEALDDDEVQRLLAGAPGSRVDD